MNMNPKVFFTSDLHLDHGNIAGPTISRWNSGYRDFLSLEEMNTTIIDNINNTVGEHDVLYFLGDFCFKNHSLTPFWRKKIHCKNVHWIAGNHDKKIDLYKDYFSSTSDTRTIYVENQSIFLSHYAHRVWDKSHHGRWHLYGHSHSSLEHIEWGKSIDVGIDNAYRLFGKYKPFSFEELKEILDKRSVLILDHHNSKTT